MSKIEFEYVDHYGDDYRISDSARVSFGQESSHFSKERNDKLIKYLIKHGHNSTLRHCVMTARIKLPLWLHAQLVKSRIGFEVNTISRRYVQTDLEFYKPKWRRSPKEGIKQGSGEEFLIPCNLEAAVHNHNISSLKLYHELIDEGVAIELARGVLPQNLMTRCMCTGSLEAWARIYKQRTEEGAQKDWKHITEPLNEKMSELFPVSWKELTNG